MVYFDSILTVLVQGVRDPRAQQSSRGGVLNSLSNSKFQFLSIFLCVLKKLKTKEEEKERE